MSTAGGRTRSSISPASPELPVGSAGTPAADQDFSKELNRLMDPYWRKARIAARLLIKREDGKHATSVVAKVFDDHGDAYAASCAM